MHGLLALGDFLRAGATGEVVGAQPGLEVHALLQRGRIAWATSTRSPRTFRQYLVGICGVSDGRLSGLFEACRAQKRPLGEALVAEGIATREQVVDALRQQVSTALLDFALLEPTQLLLLPRQWASEHLFTFAFDEVVKLTSEPTPLPFAPGPAELLRQFSSQLPMLQWAAHTDGRQVTAEVPVGFHALASEVVGLHEAGLGRGALQVLIRRPDDLVVGARMKEGSAWGALSLAAPVSRALAVFARGLPESAEATPAVRAALFSSGASAALTEVLSVDAQLLAALVVRNGDRPFVAREGLSAQRLTEVGETLGRATQLVRARTDVAVRLWPGWWFGVALEVGGAALWLAMAEQPNTGALSGLAWARAHALARRL